LKLSRIPVPDPSFKQRFSPALYFPDPISTPCGCLNSQE
jgi:hypothetical protein